MVTFDIADRLLHTRKMQFEGGKFTILGVPGCVTTMTTEAAMQKNTIKLMGEAKATEAFYKSAKEGGKTLYKDFLKTIKNKKETEKFILKYLAMCGWGNFTIIHHNEKDRSVLLSNEDGIFPQKYGYSRTPVCHTIRGLLAGFYSEVFGTNVECKEKACKSQGQRACVFAIGKRRTK